MEISKEQFLEEVQEYSERSVEDLLEEIESSVSVTLGSSVMEQVWNKIRNIICVQYGWCQKEGRHDLTLTQIAAAVYPLLQALVLQDDLLRPLPLEMSLILVLAVKHNLDIFCGCHDEAPSNPS